MHFITRGCYLYRYDEINCHAGCMRCNVFLNGNYIVYTRRMQKTYGIETIDEMIRNKSSLFKITTPGLMEMITYYKNKVEGLLKTKKER
ncbi:MAG: recombination protein NinG [Methanobrevibacter sp.]|nr:recombination protein NinG [Methanobrevibacter sp.]